MGPGRELFKGERVRQGNGLRGGEVRDRDWNCAERKVEKRKEVSTVHGGNGD